MLGLVLIMSCNFHDLFRIREQNKSLFRVRSAVASKQIHVLFSCIHGHNIGNRQNRRMVWNFPEHSSGHRFDAGTFSRGTQLRRDYTAPCVWDLSTTAGVGGTGFCRPGTQRDTLHGIYMCTTGFSGLFCAGFGHRAPLA